MVTADGEAAQATESSLKKAKNEKKGNKFLKKVIIDHFYAYDEQDGLKEMRVL